MNRLLKFALPVAAIAAGALAWVQLRPLRRLSAGEWLALPDGRAIAAGRYWRWRSGALQQSAAMQTFSSPEVKSADGLPFSLRLNIQFAPARVVRIENSGASDFNQALSRHYLGPLMAGWTALPGERILAEGPEAAETELRRKFETDGFTVSALKLQIVAPGNLAEQYGIRLVKSRSRVPTAPILWIGLDAADWKIINRLLDAGKLPNLRKLMVGGAYGRMRPFHPIISPLLWTTMATGKTPGEHNITDFVVQKGDGSLRAIGSNYRLVKALWEIAPLADRRVAFMDWWATFPAEETRGGVMLSNAFRQVIHLPNAADAKSVTFPAGYLAEHLPRLQQEYDERAAALAPVVTTTDAEMAAAVKQDAEKKPKAGKKLKAQGELLVLRDAVSSTRGHTQEAAWLSRNLKPDLLAVYYEGIDMVGHRFQHCMTPSLPNCPPEDARRYGGTVDAFYEFQDAMIGQLLAAQPGPHYTLVVSDHGFFSGDDRPKDMLPYTDENPVQWHREEAVFILNGPGIKPGPLAVSLSVYDVMPTLLYLLGMPTAGDMHGEIARAAFTEEFLRAHPPAEVKSYEELGPPHTVSAAEADPAVEKEIIANLARLGYVSPSTAAGNTSTPGIPAAHETATDGAHRNRALSLSEAGDYAGALREIEQISAEQLAQGRVLSLHSKALDALGRHEEAAQLLRDGLAAKKTEPGALMWLIQLDLGAGDIARAEKDFALSRGVEGDKHPATALACEGLILAARHQIGPAREKFWAALAADPTMAQAAESLYENLTPAETPRFVQTLQAALKTNPNLGEYHFMLGALLAQNGQAVPALEAMRRAVDAEPLNDRYASAYASMLAGAGRSQEAESLLITQTGRHPQVEELWETLGNVRGQRRDFAGAAAAFGRARAAGGTGARLFAGLAATLAQTGRLAEARTAIEEGLRLHPDDPALLAVRRQLAGRR